MVKVNLTKKIEGGRYCRAVFADNGRIKPDWVTVNGMDEKHPEGAYYIDWTDDGKRKRRAVGKSAASALAQKLRKEAELEATARGIQVVVAGTDRRIRIQDATVTYLEEVKQAKKPKTFSAYNTSLGYFIESCNKTYLEEIERGDLLKFSAFLRDKKEQSPRSVRNKFENVMTFLKSQGIIGVIRKGDRPSYVLSEPEVYEKEELDEFFNVCDEREKLWFQFFLMTGMREQEVIYTMQRNISVPHLTVSMTEKPEFKWYPKGYKEREIPVPSSLIDAIVAARTSGWAGRDLLFHTAIRDDNPRGGPKFDFLDCCKAIATRGGLDPSNWWLHKFRATFATWHLQNGVDLRTMQKWMGHVDLESTMRYLKPARNAQVRDRVNSTFG